MPRLWGLVCAGHDVVLRFTCSRDVLPLRRNAYDGTNAGPTAYRCEFLVLKVERRNEAIQMRDRDIHLAHERLDNIERWLTMWTRLPFWRRLRWVLLGR